MQLLADLRTLFEGRGKLSTEQVLQELSALGQGRWRYFHSSGEALNPRDLSKLLRPFRVRPVGVWVGGRNLKGYNADDLHDASERYLARA